MTVRIVSTLHFPVALTDGIIVLEIYGQVETDKSVDEKRLRWTWKTYERLRNASYHGQPNIISILVSLYEYLVGGRFPVQKFELSFGQYD